MKKSKVRVILSFFCILLGFCLFGFFAWSLRSNYRFPVEAYWVSFILVSIPLLCDVIFPHSSPKFRFVYLLSYSMIIHLQYAVIDSSPFLISIDGVFDYKLTEAVIRDSRWSMGMGRGIAFAYSFYPASNFLYATISMLTGIPLILVCKYLFIIRGLVIPPLIDRWFRGFFDQDVAYLATAILLSTPGSVLFPHKEPLALIFFSLGIYAITKITRSGYIQYLLIGIISIPALISTHHLTTYVFFGILSSLIFASYIYKYQRITARTQIFILCYIFFAAWITFIAWTIAAMHTQLLFRTLFQVLTFAPVTPSELMQGFVPYESTIVWLGFIILAVSSIVGFLDYVRNGKNRSFIFMTITLFLLILVAFTSIFRFAPSWVNILLSHRPYEFIYFGIGPLSALSFVKITRLMKKSTLKAIPICAIITMMIIGPIAGPLTPRLPNKSKVVSYSALSLSTWIGESTHDGNIIGDWMVNLIISGYAEKDVTIYPKLFISQELNLTELTNTISKKLYLVIYTYLNEFSYLMRVSSLNETCIKKFDVSPYFDTVYSNGLFRVYEIAFNHTSS